MVPYTLTRRKFLKSLSAVAAFVSAPRASSLLSQPSSEPHIAFPTEPRERICIPSYPFRAFIKGVKNPDRDNKLPGMTLSEFPAHVVDTFGIRNIEPLSDHFPSLAPQFLDSFRASMEKASVRPVNIAVGAEHSFYDTDAATREKSVALAKAWVDVAVRIGSPGIRTHVRSAKNSAPDVDRAAESLRKVADYGAEKNIVISLENDDLVSEDAFFLVKVIAAVNKPYLRALPDFANSMLTGDPDFDYRALTAMFQHAYNICHIKDGETNDSGKLFTIDMKRSFDILKTSGYRGYCSMEYDAPGDPYPPTKHLIEQTLKYLS